MLGDDYILCLIQGLRVNFKVLHKLYSTLGLANTPWICSDTINLKPELVYILLPGVLSNIPQNMMPSRGMFPWLMIRWLSEPISQFEQAAKSLGFFMTSLWAFRWV
jgi:hypothetical protein